MEILIDEKNFFIVKMTNKDMKKYVYLDKFNKIQHVRYQMSREKYLDIKPYTNKKRKYLPAIIYNFDKITDEKDKIIIAEDEEMADFFNKNIKNKKIIAITILSSIDRADISEKTLEYFRNKDIYIICFNEQQHKELKQILVPIANNVVEISAYRTNENESFSKTDKTIQKIIEILKK